MITKAFAPTRDDRLRLNEDQQMDFGVGIFNEGSRSRDTIICHLTNLAASIRPVWVAR